MPIFVKVLCIFCILFFAFCFLHFIIYILFSVDQSLIISIISIILFSLGFSIVFISFGATATFLGSLVLDYSYELRIIAGIFIIIFSLQIIGLINIKFLNYEKRVHSNITPSNFGSILIGMAFGFGWTPCIGPILGSILALAAVEDSINKGVLLLFFYSLGLAIPFVLSGYLIQRFMIFSKNLKNKMQLISKIGGGLLLITGILMITNQLQALGFYLLEYIPVLGNFG